MPLEPLNDIREALCKRVKKCNRTDVCMLAFILDVLEKGRMRYDDPRLTPKDWNMWSLLYALTTEATDADVRALSDYLRAVARERMEQRKK